MQKIILTGASGYVGTSFIRKFAKKYEFILISKNKSIEKYNDIFPNLQVLNVDDINVDTFQNKNIYAFVHLAAFGSYLTDSKHIKDLIRANIELPTKILDLYSTSGGINFLNIGSYWQHYRNNTYFPNSLYAASKQAFEDIVDFYVLNKNFNAITIKLFETYGPNDPRPKLLKLVYDAGKGNHEIDLTSGNQLANYTHIDDISEAINIALQSFNRGHHKYLVKSSKTYKLKEIIEKFVSINHLDVKLKWGERPHSKRDFFHEVNIHPILPGWSDTIKIDEGLKELYQS